MTFLKNNFAINLIESQMIKKKKSTDTTTSPTSPTNTSTMKTNKLTSTINSTTKKIKNNIVKKINNNNNNNIKEEKGKLEIIIPQQTEALNDYELLVEIMNNEGYTKSCIFDFNSGDNESGFTIGYHEFTDITNILNGAHSIGLFIDSKRYFINYSNDLFISGRDVNNPENAFLLRRTTNKVIIGLFNSSTLSYDTAHQIIGDIYTVITTNDKNELISNLLNSFGK